MVWRCLRSEQQEFRRRYSFLAGFFRASASTRPSRVASVTPVKAARVGAMSAESPAQNILPAGCQPHEEHRHMLVVL